LEDPGNLNQRNQKGGGVPDIHEQEAPSGELKEAGFEGRSGFFG